MEGSSPFAQRPSSMTRLPDLGLWSKMPSKFFGSGTAANLGQSASLFYLGLCEHGNRNENNTFKASDAALASDTGLSTRTICNARKRLIEKGLITCARGEGESYIYTLQPLSLKWVPLKERARPKRKPRALRAFRTTPSEHKTDAERSSKVCLT